jgi:hypothetical protein
MIDSVPAPTFVLRPKRGAVIKNCRDKARRVRRRHRILALFAITMWPSGYGLSALILHFWRYLTDILECDPIKV